MWGSVKDSHRMLFIFSNIHNRVFNLLLSKGSLVAPPLRAAGKEDFEEAELSVLRSVSTRAELLPFPSLTLQAGFDSIHQFLPTTLNNAAGEPPVRNNMKEISTAFPRLTAGELFLKWPWPLIWVLWVNAAKEELGFSENIPHGKSAVAWLNILLDQEKPFTQVKREKNLSPPWCPLLIPALPPPLDPSLKQCGKRTRPLLQGMQRKKFTIYFLSAITANQFGIFLRDHHIAAALQPKERLFFHCFGVFYLQHSDLTVSFLGWGWRQSLQWTVSQPQCHGNSQCPQSSPASAAKQPHTARIIQGLLVKQGPVKSSYHLQENTYRDLNTPEFSSHFTVHLQGNFGCHCHDGLWLTQSASQHTLAGDGAVCTQVFLDGIIFILSGTRQNTNYLWRKENLCKKLHSQRYTVLKEFFRKTSHAQRNIQLFTVKERTAKCQCLYLRTKGSYPGHPWSVLCLHRRMSSYSSLAATTQEPRVVFLRANPTKQQLQR